MDTQNPAGASAPEPPRPRYSLSINSASVFLAGVAIQAIGFVGSLFVYRFLGGGTAGQARFGTVQFFLLIASTINSLADVRMGSGYQFFLARGRPAKANTATYLVLRFLLVGGAAAAMFAVSGVSVDGATIASSPYEFEVLGIFLLLPLLWTVETVYQNYNIGLGNSVRAQYPALLEVIVRTPVIIAVAFYSPTMLGLATAYLAGAAAAALFSLPGVISLLGKIRWKEGILLFRYSWPLLGALGLGTIATSMIPFVVQASLGAAVLNQFNLANGFRVLTLALSTAIVVPLFPYMAALHRRADYQGIREGIWNALRYTSMLLIPAVVAISVYRVNILVVINSSYLPAATPLAILVISAIPTSLTGIMGVGLAAIGWRRLELFLTAAQVALLFGIAIAFLPPYGLFPASQGLLSASIAILVSAIAGLALNAFFTRRLMAVHVFPRSIGFIALSAALSFFAISRANSYLPAILDLDSAVAQLVLGVVIGGLVYFFVLALVGELAKEDIRRVGGSLGVPRRWLEIAARLCWRTATLHVVQPVDVARVPGLVSGNTPDVEPIESEVPAGKGPGPG